MKPVNSRYKMVGTHLSRLERLTQSDRGQANKKRVPIPGRAISPQNIRWRQMLLVSAFASAGQPERCVPFTYGHSDVDAFIVASHSLEEAVSHWLPAMDDPAQPASSIPAAAVAIQKRRI